MSEEDNNVSNPKLRGYLVIYVDGYKTYDKYLIHLVSDGKTHTAISDRLVPPPNHAIGSDEWWYGPDGWAVGDNSRGRLCKRNGGSKPLRKFHYFDDAVAYVFHRQRKHKNHRHALVYVTTGVGGGTQMQVVRSLDDIIAIETQISNEEAAVEQRRMDFFAEHPHLQALQDRYGKSAGWTLSIFHSEMQKNGADAAKASTSRSTYYRNIERLRAAGIEV